MERYSQSIERGTQSTPTVDQLYCSNGYADEDDQSSLGSNITVMRSTMNDIRNAVLATRRRRTIGANIGATISTESQYKVTAADVNKDMPPTPVSGKLKVLPSSPEILDFMITKRVT